VSLRAVLDVGRMGYGKGRNIASLQPTPRKLNPDLLQALHGIKSVWLFPKGAKLVLAGRRGDGRLHEESGEVRVLLPTGQSQSGFRRLSVLERCSD
jgi:hypothetical protein